MNYNWCFNVIKKEGIKCVFELGARDCLDSVTLHEYFNCQVVSFECNPDCIRECNKTLKMYSHYPILLVEKAVHEKNEMVSFMPFNKEKYDNIGASSLFEIDFTSNRHSSDPDYGKNNVQDIIKVEAIRLDSFIENYKVNPDIIFMDIQEAELLALKGLGDNIYKVKYLVFEASSCSTYRNGCNFMDIHNYLTSKNFRFVKSSQGNELPGPTQYFNFFDCIYINNNNLDV